MHTLTLFVSSPGDVRDERQAVGRIVERLQARYWNFIRLEPVLWEKEPLRATAHFNEELIRPSDCDLFVCILWSRLGSPLPSQFNRKDGTRFDSGTEWELEEATEAFEQRVASKEARPKPDILVYRRMSEPPPGGDEEGKRGQRKKLDAFCERYFFNPDRTIRRAFSPYETVDEFMGLFEQHLEKLLLRHIQLQRGLAEEAVRPLPLEGSPFKGLGAFEFEDAPLFFGRNRPISEALARLKENHAAGHAFLLIYGGSGYGKSSLMRAGLAPRLTADGYLPEAGAWCGTTVLPVEGDAPPLETLARGILEALPELAKIRDTSQGGVDKKWWDSARLTRTLGDPEQLVFAIAAVVAALDRLSAAKPAHLLVLVDQLEEIFTAKDVTDAMRDGFFHALAALAMSRRVWVVATMRSEFFPRVPEHRDLFQLVRHGGGYILSPPELPELHQIIRYPALAAGLQFERHAESGRDLSEQIYQDAANAQDALPLLEFTLEELYQRRRDNLLTWGAYEELGGLSGAIARRAQETYDGLPLETRREAAKRIFGELVTLDAANEGPATRRRAKRERLEDAHPGAPEFLRAFIGAKLLVTGSEDDEATVTLAHEALITHWPVLNQWIADHRDLLMARRRLEDAARLWTGGQRSAKFFLTEGRLAEAERVAGCGVFLLAEDEEELVRLSRLRARRKLRLFQGATAVFAVLAVGAGALGVVARNKQREAEAAEVRANLSAEETRRSLAAADFDAGAARVASGSPDEALPYLLAALESDPRNADAQALLRETLRRTTWHFPTVEIRHPLPVRALAFGAEPGALFASIDTASSAEGFNTTLRWDLDGLAIRAMLSPQWAEITQTLSIAPGGRHALVQRDYKHIGPTYLCDAVTMRVVAMLPVSLSETVPATCFAWSPDGALLAFPAQSEGEGQGEVWRIVDAATGRTVRETAPLPLDGPTWTAAQLDRTRLRAVAADGAMIEVPLRPDEPVRESAGMQVVFSWAVFSPDGGQVLGFAASDAAAYDYPFHRIYKVVDETLELQSAEYAEAAEWANARALAERFPWAAWESPFWERMQSRPGELPLALRGEGSRLEVTLGDASGDEPVAPVRADSSIEAAALSGNLLAVGTSAGALHVQELLPAAGHGFPQVAPVVEDEEFVDETSEENEGWREQVRAQGLKVERRGLNWRVVPDGGGEVALLQTPMQWNFIENVAVSTDGRRLAMGGYSSGSGGYSSAGLYLADAATGARISDLEPVREFRGVVFLGDSHRLAAFGASDVLIAEAGEDGFKRLGVIPAADALAVHYIGSRGLIAIATPREVSLYQAEDFSLVATLPVGGRSMGWHDWEAGSNAWAWDEKRGWLARSEGGLLTVWSLASRRALVSGVRLPAARVEMEFVEKDGAVGLEFTGTFEHFLPLAGVDGVSTAELAALRAGAEALSGAAFAGEGRSLARLAAAERGKRAAAVDRKWIAEWVPGAGAALDRIVAITPREAAAAAFLPVWDRLATAGEADDSVARWAAALGPDHPWFQAYLRGLISASDQVLYAGLRTMPDPNGVPPTDDDVAHFHRLAGDSAETAKRKQAAWLASRTRPEFAGQALAGDDTREEYPELDFAAIAKLEPAALEALREALSEGDQGDFRLQLLDDLRKRPAALELLDAQVAATLAAYEKEATAENATAHAEALAQRGLLDEAAKFLDGKLSEDAALSLGGAHFLIAAGLPDGGAVGHSLDRLASPWLWSAWVSAATKEEIAGRVERAVTAADGRGKVVIDAAEDAIRLGDAAAIATVIRLAKDLPPVVRDYLTARVLWLEGRTTEVFAIWPEGMPPYNDLARESDLLGWERILLTGESDTLSEELKKELGELAVNPEGTLEEHRILGERLLLPETTATYGAKRVREALLACALALSDDPWSAELVQRMVDQARIIGASYHDSLRVEARSLASQGEFTAAYAHWLQLFDSDGGGILPSDYLEAARCVMEDLQDAPAVELIHRGMRQFPADAEFALDGAWLLLTTGHAEDAGILLEHGFEIPFPKDQSQTAYAMMMCASELTGRHDLANSAFEALHESSPDWGDEESILTLDWPEDLKLALLSVAARYLPEELVPRALPAEEEEDGDSPGEQEER